MQMADSAEARTDRSPSAGNDGWQLEKRHRRNHLPSPRYHNNMVNSRGGHAPFFGNRKADSDNNVRRQGDHVYTAVYNKGPKGGSSGHDNNPSGGHVASNGTGGALGKKKGNTNETTSIIINDVKEKNTKIMIQDQQEIDFLRSRGVSQDVVNKVNHIKAEYGYFSVEEIYHTLKGLEYEVGEASRVLSERKSNSWSSLVQRNLPAPATAEVASNNGQRKGKKGVTQAPSNTSHASSDIDPVMVSQSIDECLKETQEAAKMLLELKQELLDSTNNQKVMEELNREKQNLLERKENISKEKVDIDERLAQIEMDLIQINIDTVNKVSQIAQKLPKASSGQSLIKPRKC